MVLGAPRIGTAGRGPLSSQNTKPAKFESSFSFQCWLWAEDVFLGYLLRQLSLVLSLAVFHVPWGAPVTEFMLQDPTLRQQLDCT